MKVLVATGLYPPEIGGPATYARMIETELPERGVAVTVLPFGTVRRYPRVIKHALYAWKLFGHARTADVVYALDPHSVGWPALLVATLRRKRLLVRLGGDYAWEIGCARCGMEKTLDEYTADKRGVPLWVRFLAWMQTFMVRRAARVIVPSAYLGRIVASWGVPEKRITVIYSVLFPLTVTTTRDTLRRELGYTFPTIVSAGRLVPWKGFSMLIDVVGELRAQFPDVQLIIAGDGAERAALEAQVRARGLQDNVRFVGSVSKDALGATIKAADLFVLNTSYEGLSHQLLEVMDLGVPIVTTDVGGNPELIEHEQSGVLVPPNDADALQTSMAHLLTDDTLRTRVIGCAQARTHDFTTARSIDALYQILHHDPH